MTSESGTRAGGVPGPRFGHAMVLGLIAAVSALHYLTPVSSQQFNAIYQRLYYLPILLACYHFGLKGGLGYAALCGLATRSTLYWGPPISCGGPWALIIPTRNSVSSSKPNSLSHNLNEIVQAIQQIKDISRFINWLKRTRDI